MNRLINAYPGAMKIQRLIQLLITIILVILSGKSFSQTGNTYFQKGTSDQKQKTFCSSEEILKERMEKSPEFRKQREQMERDLQKYMALSYKKANAEVNGDIITIPVVFHILHDNEAIGTGRNISADLINAQIDQLNDDFRRLNADASDTPAEFLPVAADTKIEFCLASTAPDGSLTQGINRLDINSLANNISFSDCWNPEYIDTKIKAPTIWNRNSYLNIWTVDDIMKPDCISNSTIGYSSFPGDPASSDGVVMEYDAVGSIDLPNPNATSDFKANGRITIHEVGHFLGLYHVFQGGCDNSDLVSDTPAQSEPFWISDCSSVSNSCDEGSGDLNDMYQNYMSYSVECFNLFTLKQKERILGFMNTTRVSLKNSKCAGNPPNDICQDAIDIETCESIYGSTINASFSTEPTCASSSNVSPDVWFRLVGDGDVYTISTCNAADFDTVLEVYTGSCNSLICWTWNDQSLGCGNTSSLNLDTSPGQVYFIAVSGYYTGQMGTFELTVYKNQLVTSQADSGPGSLREIISCAPPGSTIQFDSALDYLLCCYPRKTIIFFRPDKIS